jgi:hypothetical protein
MADWPRVKWSEASQVLEQLGDSAAEMPEAGTSTPAAYFEKLRGEELLAEAVRFIAHALPRLETVAWAARTVRDLPPPDGKASRADELALRAALFWVGDPTENRRYAAYNAALTASDPSPETMAALAAAFSGGSIAPQEQAPLPVPREAVHQCASGAVLGAASRSGDMEGALTRALDLGAAIAIRGLEAATA